jgi:hypothetical protein
VNNKKGFKDAQYVLKLFLNVFVYFGLLNTGLAGVRYKSHIYFLGAGEERGK